MCLIFFAIDQHPEYKVIVAGNRDEFYNRQTAPADFWNDHPELLGGRDLEAMGTWLGMTRSGKISMLTNYRDLSTLKSQAPSRGKLVSDYLIGSHSPHEYLLAVSKKGQEFNGFNLLVGDVNGLWYYSNYGDGIRHLVKGIFGLSNHLLDTPWPKVKKGKSEFERILALEKIETEMLFRLLIDEEVAPDDTLPATGLSIDQERALSSMFIKSPGYGSRCSTVILVNRNNEVTFSERVFDLQTFAYETQTFEFTVEA